MSHEANHEDEYYESPIPDSLKISQIIQSPAESDYEPTHSSSSLSISSEGPEEDDPMSEDELEEGEEADNGLAVDFLEDEQVYVACKNALTNVKRGLTRNVGDRLKLKRISEDEVVEFMDYLWEALVESYSAE